MVQWIMFFLYCFLLMFSPILPEEDMSGAVEDVELN